MTVADLIYAKQSRGKVRWVLAVPEDSITSAQKIWTDCIVATELVNVTRKLFRKKERRACGWSSPGERPK